MCNNCSCCSGSSKLSLVLLRNLLPHRWLLSLLLLLLLLWHMAPYLPLQVLKHDV
jgi:hypothetical protein